MIYKKVLNSMRSATYQGYGSCEHLINQNHYVILQKLYYKTRAL